MPGAMEATEGIAPEIDDAQRDALAGGDELSPEEQAIQGIGVEQTMPDDGDEDRKDVADEDADTAALAEGRRRAAGVDAAVSRDHVIARCCDPGGVMRRITAERRRSSDESNRAVDETSFIGDRFG